MKSKEFRRALIESRLKVGDRLYSKKSDRLEDQKWLWDIREKDNVRYYVILFRDEDNAKKYLTEEELITEFFI